MYANQPCQRIWPYISSHWPGKRSTSDGSFSSGWNDSGHTHACIFMQWNGYWHITLSWGEGCKEHQSFYTRQHYSGNIYLKECFQRSFSYERHVGKNTEHSCIKNNMNVTIQIHPFRPFLVKANSLGIWCKTEADDCPECFCPTNLLKISPTVNND